MMNFKQVIRNRYRAPAVGSVASWDPAHHSGLITLSMSNLQAAIAATGAYGPCLGLPGWSTGNHYFEAAVTYPGGSPFMVIGLGGNSPAFSTFPGSTTNSYGYYQQTGQKYTNSSPTTYGATYANGDVIGVQYNAASGTITFYKNGVSQGTAFTGISGTLFPGVGLYQSGSSVLMHGNAASILFLPSGASPWGT